MILVGWKQIARYLDIGVRTAQRWELWGLPVRRPSSRIRGSVLVTTDALNNWVSQCGNGRDAPCPSALPITPGSQVDPLSRRLFGMVADKVEVGVPKRGESVRKEHRKTA